MKIFLKYLLLAILFLSFQTSCKKSFLEIEPKGTLIARYTKDYEQLLNAAYLQAISSASGFMGDEVAAQKTYFAGAPIRTQRLFKFEDRVYQPDELPAEINNPDSYIQRLYLFNKIINEVMVSEGGTEEQKKATLAEAKVGRALCNLMFLNDFSLPYNEATASTDPGIPLITVADVTELQFIRSSVKDGYESMIKDLTEALPDLGPLVHRAKFSKATAEFYLGRIYLYMAKFTEARTHIDAAFAEIGNSSIPLALYDYNKVLAPGGEWGVDMDFGFGPATMPLPINNTQQLYNIQMSTFNISSMYTYLYSPQTAALFNSSDKRLALFSRTDMDNSVVFPNNMRRFPGFFIDIGPSLPDLYLMRAELKARANDLVGAKMDLETLREKRMSDGIEVPVSIATNQDALMKFVLEERVREFAMTGMRWLDMRRLSVDPKYKNTVKYTHEMYDDAGSVVATFTLNPQRFALKFGELMLQQNEGLTENP